PTKVIQSPLEEMPPQTARMADAPAREETRPRTPVNSGAGALAAAVNAQPIQRSPAILASTRPSAGNEAFMRPAAPDFSTAPPRPADRVRGAAHAARDRGEDPRAAGADPERVRGAPPLERARSDRRASRLAHADPGAGASRPDGADDGTAGDDRADDCGRGAV